MNIPTRTLRQYLSSLVAGSSGSLVGADLTVRSADDFATDAQGQAAETALQGVVGDANIEVDNTVPTVPALSLSPAILDAIAASENSVLSVVAGANVAIDNTDPRNPIVNASGGGGGGGSVSSVGLSVPTGFAVANSPITIAGTLAVTYQAGYRGFTTAEGDKLDDLVVTGPIDLDVLAATVEDLEGEGEWITKYGAVGDDSTDNSAAIAAAVAAAIAGTRRVLIPAGIFRYSGTIEIDEIIQIIGVGASASHLVYTGTNEAMIWQPSTTNPLNNMFWGMRDVRLDHVTPGDGTAGLALITTDSEFLSNFEISNCYIGNFGGPGLILDNQTSPEMGSLFCFTVRRNFITNGIQIIRGGDSMSIVQNTLTGAGYAIEATLTAGARQLVVRENNMTTLGGVYFDECPGLVLENNWMELPSYLGNYTGSNSGYLVVFNCPGASIRRNTIQPLASVAVSSAYAVQLDIDSADVDIEGNEIATGETGHVIFGSAPRSLFRRTNLNLSGGAFVFSGAAATAVNEIDNVPLLNANQTWAGSNSWQGVQTWGAANIINAPPAYKVGTINTDIVLDTIAWNTGNTRFSWRLGSNASLTLGVHDVSGTLFTTFNFSQSGVFTTPGLALYDPTGDTLSIILATNLTTSRTFTIRVADANTDITFPASGTLATKERSQRTVTATTDTLVIGDAGGVVKGSNAAGVAITIPQVSSVAWPVGTQIDLINIDTGAVQLIAGTGVTLLSKASKKRITATFGAASLLHAATNVWILFGDIET